MERDQYNAVTAFEQRRQMFLAVQEIQRLEHETFKRMNTVIVARKRELLEILSDWLQNHGTSSPQCPEAEAISGCNLESWITLQEDAVRLQAEIDRCKVAVQDADAAHQDVAPLGQIGMGVINEWFAGKAQKVVIQELAATLRLKTMVLDEANKQLAVNVERRKIFGKQFLRGCLSNAQKLAKSAVFGKKVQEIVGENTLSIETQWLKHASEVHLALNTIEANLSYLRRMYTVKGQ